MPATGSSKTLPQRACLPDLLRSGAIAVELGVGKGLFSEQLLQHPNIGHLYSIDAWAGDRKHDDAECEAATRRLKPYAQRNTILRSTFANALNLFRDRFFDLVYIDGYAHEGESGAIESWWPKVKRGGLYAGHDYHPQWPLVMAAVDKLAGRQGLKVTVIAAEPGVYTFPSWLIRKC
jgi:methyltransferase family protein